MRFDYSHREFFRVKAGILELLWGMHHAALNAGVDAGIRLWTDGYPWRLWQIARHIPGFLELLGLGGLDAPDSDGDADPEGPRAIARHPNIFSRVNYATALELAVGWYREDPELSGLAEPLRSFVRDRLRRRRFGPTWKLPELAEWIGKPGFANASLLIDDQLRNVSAFAATGRRAVQLVTATPRVLFGRLPNSAWLRPDLILQALSTRVAAPLAEALASIHRAPAGQILRVTCSDPAPPEPAIVFAIDVPDARLRAEWIEPVRRVRAMLRR
jgi:hypothetical protein